MINKSKMRLSQNGWLILIAMRVVFVPTRDIVPTADTDAAGDIIDCISVWLLIHLNYFEGFELMLIMKICSLKYSE